MKTYVLCGLSNRSIANFVLPLTEKNPLPKYGNFTKYGRIKGILDVDEERVRAFNKFIGTDYPYYPVDALPRMIKETNPDVVMVAGPDGTHAEQIVTALQHDRDVLTEKPMVINCEQAKAVIDAERKSKGEVVVTHNARYGPASLQLKRMILDGKLGRITNVEFVYNVDTLHGSSYFWRWNRLRAMSGGLTISKGCHHFDLIHWLIDDLPAQVFAYGALNYYGKDSPYSPSKRDGKTYTLEEVKARCPYHQRWFARELTPPKDDHVGAMDIFDLPSRVMYPDGPEPYIYDAEIDIEDTYSAVVRFRRGSSMSYTCNFSAPWEGYHLAINGTEGRLETSHYTSPARCPFPVSDRQSVTYLPLFGERQVWETRPASGAHGGADPVMRWDLFAGLSEQSKALGIHAGSESGAYAAAVGELMWRSIKENRPMDVPVF